MSPSIDPIPPGGSYIPYIPLYEKDLNNLLKNLFGKEIIVYYTPRDSNASQELRGRLKFATAKDDIDNTRVQRFNVVSLFFYGDIARNIPGREVVNTGGEKATRLMFIDGHEESLELFNLACGIIHRVGTPQAFEISKKNQPNT